MIPATTEAWTKLFAALDHPITLVLAGALLYLLPAGVIWLLTR